jgi:hypothetical protein
MSSESPSDIPKVAWIAAIADGSGFAGYGSSREIAGFIAGIPAGQQLA